MRAGTLSFAARAAAVAATLAVAGWSAAACGADPHLQRQEAAMRARTCESLIERKYHRLAPRVSPGHWAREVARVPKLHAPTNQAELVKECNRIGDATYGTLPGLSSFTDLLRHLPPVSGGPAPSSTAPPGSSVPARDGS